MMPPGWLPFGPGSEGPRWLAATWDPQTQDQKNELWWCGPPRFARRPLNPPPPALRAGGARFARTHPAKIRFWIFGPPAKVENAPRFGHGWKDHCVYLSDDTDQHMLFSISGGIFFLNRHARVGWRDRFPCKTYTPGISDSCQSGERPTSRARVGRLLRLSCRRHG